MTNSDWLLSMFWLMIEENQETFLKEDRLEEELTESF